MEPRNRNILIGIAAAVLFLCACVLVIGTLGGALFFNNWRAAIRPTATLRPTQGPVVVVTQAAVARTTNTPAATSTPQRSASPAAPADTPSPAATGGRRDATPVPAPGSAAASAPAAPISDTAGLLASAALPERDMRSLALRLRPGAGDIPATVNPTPPSYKVGDAISFWVEDPDTMTHTQISATLRYITPHVYMWVQNGTNLKTSDLAASAQRFENQTYPTDREYFGSEWTPGIDNDVHLTLLHAHKIGAGNAGYYSASDEVSRLVNPYSNEKEMFYISLDVEGMTPNTDFYDGVLAHEFQHMIHWNVHRNEVSWVNEGMSELAGHLNKFDVGGFERAYARTPDTQLTTWAEAGPDDPNANVPHYGAAYLFMDYVFGRFGPDVIKSWAASKMSGSEGLDEALAAAGRSERFDDIFDDWVVANYLNRPDAEPRGRFGYTDIAPPTPSVGKTFNSFPASQRTDVSQYGADYVRITMPRAGDLSLRFQGQSSIGLTTAPPRGKYAWYSNRGDDDDMTLTRSFDLTGLSTATLNFAAWYDIEDGWDYLYVEVSTDGGKHWQILPGRHTNARDKSGNAFGPGWTGVSGSTSSAPGQTPQWIDEQVDLSKFAGQKVQVRFEYVTDDAVNRPGFLLDDLSIPELNYRSGFENGPDGWQGSGWILTDTRLPQSWLVQVVTRTGQGMQVQRMNVGADGRGDLIIKNEPNASDVMLIVSAEAPVTTERASYNYTLALAP